MTSNQVSLPDFEADESAVLLRAMELAIKSVEHSTPLVMAQYAYSALMPYRTTHEKSALPPVCVWTQLPDDPNPLELHRVQATTACGGSVMGAYPFYPDNCIYCHKRVAWLAVVGRSAVETNGWPEIVVPPSHPMAAERAVYLQRPPEYGDRCACGHTRPDHNSEGCVLFACWCAGFTLAVTPP